jgi:hypothetical protein
MKLPEDTDVLIPQAQALATVLAEKRDIAELSRLIDKKEARKAAKYVLIRA